MRPTAQLAPLLALSLLAACGDMSDSASFSDVGNWQDVMSDTSPADTTWADASTPDVDTSLPDTTPPPPPPEEEVDFDLRTPEAGTTFLYIPSAALDALIVVDARSLEVHLVDVGLVPTLVRALPGDEGAVVLNEGSSDVSIVRPTPVGSPPRLTFEVATHPVLAGSNRLVVSPDGTVAFAFHVASGASFGSLQDVSAIHLGTPPPGVDPALPVLNLAVGLRPSEIRFADDGRLALILCEDGLSGIRLADLLGDTFLPPVPTSPDRFRKQTDRELVTTPDGRHAIVRDLDQTAIALVDLQTGQLTQLALPDYASDLDLTRDGKTLVVPLRTRQEVARITIPDAFTWVPPAPPTPPVDPPVDPESEPTDPESEPTDPPTDPSEPAAEEPPAPQNPFIHVSPTGAPFGSAVLTADERHALLYTTTPGVASVGRLDLASGGVVIQPLPKELEAVVPSPDARMAALLHRRSSGSGDLASRPAYSLLDLASGYSKLVVTPNPVTTVTFTPDASELFALLPDPLGASHQVDRVKTRSFAVTSYPVPDRPVFVGAMPALTKVAVALDNPTGWITFIDTQTGATLQLNSFELNGFIE